jgi:hypothetical protein
MESPLAQVNGVVFVIPPELVSPVNVMENSVVLIKIPVAV